MAVRDFFPQGIDLYVPAAKYSADLNMNGLNWVSLGTPAAGSATAVDTAIDANAAVGTEDSVSWTSGSPYGRSLILTPSGDPGAAGAIDVYGYDYLGQLVIERFTTGGAGNVVLYGKKAFKRVFKTKIVTASSNAVTYNLGTANRLGLPYKGVPQIARENNILIPVQTTPIWQWADISATDGAAGFSRYIRAPFAGYVKTLKAISDGAGGATDPVVTVELSNVVTGLTVTVDTSAAGNEVTDTPTTPGYRANNRFIAGNLIKIVGAAAAGAKGFRVGVELNPVQFTEFDLTDPQTNATADPRGLYHPNTVMDDTLEIEIGLIPDNYVNSSGNGGLFGIRHYGG